MNKWKRGVAFGMAALMLCATAMLSGCGKDEAANGETTKKLTISVYDRGMVPTSEGTYSDNRWTRWIKEQTGIDVEWVPVPRNDATKKLSLLVASGEAPNIITEYDQNFIRTLYSQGILQPIDDLVANSSTSYKAYLEAHPELLPYVTFDDGKMYAFTNVRSQDSVANHSTWIRQDWLDKVGMDMPQTTDELIEVAKAFRDKDPDGNGQNDTYGISFMNWEAITAAMFQANTLWYEEDGQLVYGPLTDRFADALAFAKTLYTEKLIDPEFITDKDYSRQKQFWVTGKAGILFNTWQETLCGDLLKNDPNAKPVPLAPVESQYGRNGYWQETEAERYSVLTNTLEDPEVAMEFLDWMIEDGWFTLQFGLEGEHYQMEDGVPQVIDAEKNDVELKYSVDYHILRQWDLQPEWIPKMAAKDETSQHLAELKAQSLESTLLYPFRRDLPYEPAMEELTKLKSDFAPIEKQVRIDVITGDKTPEQGLEEYRAEWKRLGGDEVDKLVNEWYQANKANLTK